jgi:hypothetical protein
MAKLGVFLAVALDTCITHTQSERGQSRGSSQCYRGAEGISDAGVASAAPSHQRRVWSGGHRTSSLRRSTGVAPEQRRRGLGMAGITATTWRRPGGARGLADVRRRRRGGRERAQQGVEVVAEAHHQAAWALEVAGDRQDRPTRRQAAARGEGEWEGVREGEERGGLGEGVDPGLPSRVGRPIGPSGSGPAHFW